jgi:hypothetical protein
MRPFDGNGMKLRGCSVLMVARGPPYTHTERFTTVT